MPNQQPTIGANSAPIVATIDHTLYNTGGTEFHDAESEMNLPGFPSSADSN